MKPQLLLAEGSKRMNSSIIILETKMLRDSKSMGIFWLFAISVLKTHFIVDSFLRSRSSQHIPGDKRNERTLLNHPVIFFKAHSSYINIYINIFLFITNTRQALVTLRVHLVSRQSKCKVRYCILPQSCKIILTIRVFLCHLAKAAHLVAAQISFLPIWATPLFIGTPPPPAKWTRCQKLLKWSCHLPYNENPDFEISPWTKIEKKFVWGGKWLIYIPSS